MTQDQWLWANCCFFIGGLMWVAGCIQMRLAYAAGERVGSDLGKAIGLKEGDATGGARGFLIGFRDGKKHGYELGKRDALPVRGSRGRFTRRPS